MQKTISSRVPHTILQSSLLTGTKIWIFHRSSKHVAQVEWIKATVIEPNEHHVGRKIDKHRAGLSMFIAYEDIKIRTNGELAAKPMAQSLAVDTTPKNVPVAVANTQM